MRDEKRLQTIQFRLREVRRDLNMSQRVFADMVGASKQAISDYENGVRTPNVSFLACVTEATGVSLEYLVGIHDVKQPEMWTASQALRLNERAINEIQKERSALYLNYLALQPDFWGLISRIGRFILNKPEGEISNMMRFLIYESLKKLLDAMQDVEV